jgi:hypothetical protein
VRQLALMDWRVVGGLVIALCLLWMGALLWSGPKRPAGSHPGASGTEGGEQHEHGREATADVVSRVPAAPEVASIREQPRSAIVASVEASRFEIVVRDGAGASIPRAIVELEAEGVATWRSETDVDGRCVLVPRPAGVIHAAGHAVGYARSRASVDAEGPSRVVLVLSKERSIRGRVVLASGRAPSQSISVAAWSSLSTPSFAAFVAKLDGAVVRTTTDSTGTYVLEGLPDDRTVHVACGAPGMVSREIVDVPPGVQEARDLIVGYLFGGIVSFGEPGEALGRTRLASVGIDVDPPTPSDVGPTSPLLALAGLEAPLARRPGFVGAATSVVAWRPESSSRTLVTVRPRIPGYEPREDIWVLPALREPPQEHRVALQRNAPVGSLRLVFPGETIRGLDTRTVVSPHDIVLTSADGQPIGYQSRIASVVGQSDVGVLPAGAYDLILFVAGTAIRIPETGSMRVDVAADEETVVELPSTPTGSVEFYRGVTDPDRHPDGMRIRIAGSPDLRWILRSQPYVITGVPAGRHSFEIHGSGGEFMASPELTGVEIESGGWIRLRLPER